MLHHMDLPEVAWIIGMLGVGAVVADAGSRINCRVRRAVAELDGAPRYTILAGSGWPRTGGGRLMVLGDVGEFGFHQDADGDQAAHVVREHYTPSQIAKRIVRLHQAVQERALPPGQGPGG
jgi:hypothetical protein